MKLFKVFLSAVLCCTIFLQGCTYHGKIRRGVYKGKDSEEKVGLKVMVVGNDFTPERLRYADKIFWQDFDINIRLDDGMNIAVADALGTLFSEVEVNDYKLRKNYDLIAEIGYSFTPVTTEDAGKVYDYAKKKYVKTILLFHFFKTNLTINLRNPHTGYLVARYTQDSSKYIPQTMLLNFSKTLGVFSLGILSPAYIQGKGSQMRKLIETDLTDSLYTLMREMRENREIFFDINEQEKLTKRYDAQYEPMMKKTVRIEVGGGLGSGFLVSPKGYIITNAHVVAHARDVVVKLYDDPTYVKPEETLPIRYGRVLKRNIPRDLALVKIEGENYPFFDMETNPENYRTGEEVVAIGTPKGFDWTLSKGVISKTWVNPENSVHEIQTDTPILHGNSGGPLISLKTGKVVGVNSRGPNDVLNWSISTYEVQRTLGVKQPIDDDDWDYLLLQ